MDTKNPTATVYVAPSPPSDPPAIPTSQPTLESRSAARPRPNNLNLRPPPPASIRRRRRRSNRKFAQTWQSASFHFGLFMTFLAIGFVWSITPISWGYVLWTAFSQLGPTSRRPAPPGSSTAFTVLHYLCLTYTSVECLFSIYYRFLAYKAQKIRAGPLHSRKFLRGLILRSLENGLYPEEELEDEELDEAEDKIGRGGVFGKRVDGTGTPISEEEWQALARDEEEAARGSDSDVSPTWKQRIRRRAQNPSGDGAHTPELRTNDFPGKGSGDDYLSARQLPTLQVDDSFDGSNGRPPSVRTLDSAMAASPLSYGNPQLPTVASTSFPPPAHQRHKHAHPFSPYLRVRLSPDDPRALDFRSLFRFWFAGAEWERIGKLNVADWFSWSLYGQPLEELEKERKEWDKQGRPARYLVDGTTLDTDSDLEDEHEHEEGNEEHDGQGGDAETRSQRRRVPAIEGDKLGLVNHCVSLVEARSAHHFTPGRNPKVRATRLTLDPVKVTSRPLILYGVVALLQKAVIGRAKMSGFKQMREGETSYLLYVPDGWKPCREPRECERPLVFIHGLGMGTTQYATLIHVLCSSPAFRTRPILILLQPHISMSFFQKGYLDPPNQERCTTGLAKVLRKHGFDENAGGCTVLSHSNGSIVHGWLVKDYPSLCARSCFVDSVCFCLWEPWVCHNFLVRRPSKPIEFLMRYFVSRELGVALMLSRTFEWTSNLLFPSQIPNVSNPQKAAIFLSSEDSILNAERMKNYLKRNGMKEVKGNVRVGEREGGGGLKVFEGLKHGESMIGEGLPFEEVLAWVKWDERDPTAYSGESGSDCSPPATGGEEST